MFNEAWDETVPSDNDKISGGDDAIRQLKRAIRERLDSVFLNFVLGNMTLRQAAFQDDSIDASILKDGSVTADKLAVASSRVLKSSGPSTTLGGSIFNTGVSNSTLTFSVPGAKVGDIAVWNAYNATPLTPTQEGDISHLSIRAWVSAVDTVKLFVGNYSGSQITIPAGTTFDVAVLQGA